MAELSSTSGSLPPTLSVQTADLFPMEQWRILVVDDDEEDAMLLEDVLREAAFGSLVVDWRSNPKDGLAALAAARYSACIVDYRMGADTGIDFVEAAKVTAPHVPMLLLTGQEDTRDIDLAAMRAGAVDFLRKNRMDAETLERSLRYALEQARQRVSLERMVRRDSLTGLHNRVSIGERLYDAAQRARRNNRTMMVMMFDLDRFKAVNDQLGHDAGDRLLVIVAERVKKTLRAYDVVGRLGGDEFVAIVEDLGDPSEVDEVARRVVEAIRPPFELDASVVPDVTASVGYVRHPGQVETPEELLTAADRAMYMAKKGGGCQAHAYSPVTDTDMPRMVSTECVLGAIARNELRLAFQPQVDLRTGVVVGLEGLVRWRPTGGTDISPVAFIPELERTGAVSALDAWVFERAIDLRKRWGGLDLPIAVNISPVDLQDSSFVGTVAHAVSEGDQIELELTETALLVDRPEVRRQIVMLKDMGATLAVDDFGAGYSSLARLRDLPVDTLKIDRSFVHGVEERRDSAAIIESMVVLADRLDLRLVAEGIESRSTAERLAELGVAFGQGYLFAPTLHENDVMRWLKDFGGRPYRDVKEARCLA